VHEDRVIRGDERVRGDDHFVAGVQARGIQGRDERGGAAGGGDAALGAKQFRIGRLKNPHLPAATATAPVSAAQHLEDIRLPRLAPLRPFGPAALVGGRAAEQGRFVSLAASTVGPRSALIQASAADPAAAAWTNPRRVTLSFMA